jgi:hypothetical protein
MCPFCLASLGLIVVSATSTAGLTALAVKLSQKKNLRQEVAPNSSESSMTGRGAEPAWQKSQANRLVPGGDA